MSQLEAFVLTIVIELAVALGIMAIGRQRPTVRLVVAVVLGTVVTHPVLWAVAPAIPVGWWWPAIGALEVLIGVVEGVVVVVVGQLPWRRGMFIGVAMNAVSFGLGLLLAPFWR
jgi:hypothetical protein